MIQYVLTRYAGHAALVANTVTFRARSAIRDVGLALGLAPAQIDALARDPERPAMEGRLIVQWDKDAVEMAGLIKIDLLGLGMLAAIDRAFHLIGQQTGARPHLHGVRCDDPRVYDLFCRVDTVGIFQLESRAQMTACLPQLQPRRYEDLIAAVALIRPGPMQGNATHPYLRRRRGLEPVCYPGGAAGQRLLGPVLEETLGVCLYQDQVIAIGVACGLSADEAAELWRAMSSARDPARMDALWGRMEAGLVAQGFDVAARDEVRRMVTSFSGYGFVKGHAAAFAYLAYISAWLKVYHPVAFYAALLNMQPMGFYSPETLAQDAARHGVRTLPVDLECSRADCVVEDGALRLGFRMVRGLGANTSARLEEVVRSAPPQDLAELCVRARLEEDEAYALATSGALRGYIPERRQALWQAPPIARAARERWLPGALAAVDPPVTLPTATSAEESALDRAALGLPPGRHVLSPLRAALARYPLCHAHDLRRHATGTPVEIVGQVISRQRPGTARGVLFLGLSDETGLMNVVVAPEVYARDRDAARGEALLWVTGVVERRAGVPSVRAQRVRSLTDLISDS